MNTNTIRLNIEPSDRVVCGMAVAFGGLALINGDASMMVGCIGVPFALIWIVRLLRDNKRRSWRLRALTYTSAIAMLVAGPTSCMFHTARTEAALQPAIEALDQHRVRTGSYPEKLTELSLPKEATCPGGMHRRALYGTTSGGKQFHLTCVTFGLNRHTYESKTGRWHDWD